jgi:hypothetical protein
MRTIESFVFDVDGLDGLQDAGDAAMRSSPAGALKCASLPLQIQKARTQRGEQNEPKPCAGR